MKRSPQAGTYVLCQLLATLRHGFSSTLSDSYDRWAYFQNMSLSLWVLTSCLEGLRIASASAEGEKCGLSAPDAWMYGLHLATAQLRCAKWG